MGTPEPAGAYADDGLCQEERNRGFYEFERGERGGVGEVGGRIEGEWGGDVEDGIVSFASFLLPFFFFIVPCLVDCELLTLSRKSS